MRKLAAGAALVIGFIGLVATPAWSVGGVAQTGFNYDWWRNDDGSWGEQILVPYSAQCDIQDFSIKVLGGYAQTSTKLEIPPHSILSLLLGREGHITSVVSGALDTKVGLTYDLGDRLPVGLLFGLDFNVPTGETRFRSFQDQFLVLDPDLVSVVSLGEGFNVNPTLIVTKEWNDEWATGVGFGYAWRGDYKRFFFTQFADIPRLREFDPGDILSVTPEVRYTFAADWNARFYLNYSHFWPQEVDGEEAIDPGNYYLAGVGLNYEHAKWTSQLNLTAIFRDDFEEHSNRRTFLGQESFTDFAPFKEGNEVAAALGTSYALNDLTTLKSQLVLRYLYDTDPPRARFLPGFSVSERQLASLQFGVVRKLIPHLDAEISVKGLYMHDVEQLDSRTLDVTQDTDFGGFSAGIKLTGTF